MWTDHKVENVSWKWRKEGGSGVSLDQLDPIQSGRPCWNMAPISGVPGTPRVSPGWTGQSSEAGPEEGVGLGWARTLKVPFPPKLFHDSMIYFQIIPNSSAGGIVEGVWGSSWKHPVSWSHQQGDLCVLTLRVEVSLGWAMARRPGTG